MTVYSFSDNMSIRQLATHPQHQASFQPIRAGDDIFVNQSTWYLAFANRAVRTGNSWLTNQRTNQDNFPTNHSTERVFQPITAEKKFSNQSQQRRSFPTNHSREEVFQPITAEKEFSNQSQKLTFLSQTGRASVHKSCQMTGFNQSDHFAFHSVSFPNFV